MNMDDLILNAISQMDRLPYAYGNTVGGLKELSLQGNVVLQRGTSSICCSAVFEVLWRAFEARGVLTQLGVANLNELKKWVWVWGDEVPENQYYTGVAGGIVEMGLGTWICKAPYEIGEQQIRGYGDPLNLQCGDVAQFYDYDDNGNRTLGHSVIIIGKTTNSSGDPAVMTYSSDPNVNEGHGYDYWSLVHPTSSKRRIWFGARPILPLRR